MFRQLNFLLFVTFLIPSAFCQEELIENLDEIIISGHPLLNEFYPDSINAAPFLYAVSPFYRSTLNFREYSPGGISIFSIRGSTAQQNAVFWNGFKIENHMLGISDINLIPAALFDQIYIHKSPQTSYLINGKPGGSIHFNSIADKISPIFQISAFFDENNNSSYHFKSNLRSGSTVIAIQALLNKFNNEFNYYDLNSNKQEANHAALEKKAFTFSLSHENQNNWKFNYDIWLQQSAREIPPTIFQQLSKATLEDSHLRTAAVVNKNLSNGILELSTALMYDQLIFDDSLIQEYSDSRILDWQSQLNYRLTLANLFPIKAEAGFRKILVKTNAYEEKLEDNNYFISLSGNSAEHFSFAKIGIQLKKEINSRGDIPLLYLTQLSGIIAADLKWSISAGNHYRFPTYNDLYWPGAGNQELKPEKGRHAELTLNFGKLHSQFQQVELTTFIRQTENLIFWTNRQGRWLPENLSEVRARGLEFRWTGVWNPGQFRIQSKLGYDFVLSKLFKERFPGDPALKKQLPYLPKHTVFFHNIFSFNNWQLSTSIRSQSIRYTNSDHSSFIDPNVLMDAELSKLLIFNDLSCKLSLSTFNLTNSKYFSVANRPMPLRSIGFGIQIFFK